MHTHACTHTHTQAQAQAQAHTHTCVRTHTHTQAQAHIHTRTRTRTCTHTQVANLNNRRDKLLQEAMSQQVRPVVVDEVDDQALDVGAILVLIGHDHQLAVAEGPQISWIHVLLAVLEPQDLDNV